VGQSLHQGDDEEAEKRCYRWMLALVNFKCRGRRIDDKRIISYWFHSDASFSAFILLPSIFSAITNQ
jgi:hypothetical protein